MHAVHGPSWHSLASKAMHTQAIQIVVLVRKRSRLCIVKTHSTFTEMNILIDHLHEDRVDEWRLAACSSVGYGALIGRFDTTLDVSADFRYDCAWDIVQRPLLESSPTFFFCWESVIFLVLRMDCKLRLRASSRRREGVSSTL
jgi:hypothetical protein